MMQGVPPRSASATCLPSMERSGYRYGTGGADWRARLCGITGTASTAMLVLACAVLGWTVSTVQPAPPSRPTMVALLPLASPPDPPRDVAPGPRRTEHRRQEAAEPPASADPVPQVAVPSEQHAAPSPRDPAPVADPEPSVARTSAPRTLAAPPAVQLSDTARPNWENALLAHLERYRRYPPRARAARQQGAVYLRVRVNRAGLVLAASVERGSGAFTLDQEALDTLRRAQPLPTIPDSLPGIVDLTVPVEFRLR